MATNLNSSDEEGIISGINITPLVDVILVLLIIFLMTAPMIYQSAIKVNLARASTGEASEDKGLNITVTKSGELTFNGHSVQWQDLESQIKSLGEKVSQETAIISADRDAPHGMIVELMDTLRAAGLTRLAFNVEKAPAKQENP